MKVDNKKVLVVYFSYTGNTKFIADKINEKIGGDIVEIKTLKPYSEDFNYVVDQGKEEVDNYFKPEIITKLENIEEYDTIFIGSPTWWYTIAPPVATFLYKNNLEGKKIIPFLTNGGYGLGHSIEDIKNLCEKSIIENWIEIPFEKNDIQISIQEMDDWINKLKV